MLKNDGLDIKVDFACCIVFFVENHFVEEVQESNPFTNPERVTKEARPLQRTRRRLTSPHSVSLPLGISPHLCPVGFSHFATQSASLPLKWRLVLRPV